MSVTVRLMLAQLAVRVGDLAGNAATVRAAMQQAQEAGVDVLMTPEMTLSGYPCEDLLAEPAFVAQAQQQATALGEQATGTVACVGTPWNVADLPAAGGAWKSALALDAQAYIVNPLRGRPEGRQPGQPGQPGQPVPRGRGGAGRSAGATRWFTTHPPIEERVERLRAMRVDPVR